MEYHDILWDIGYAKTWEEASVNLLNLYQERPPLDDFRLWRDLRVMDEVHWYGYVVPIRSIVYIFASSIFNTPTLYVTIVF